MLEKIEIKEIMSTRAARKKYSTKYFRMVITDTIDQADNDMGYVIYTADDKRELVKAPMDEYKDMCVGIMIGDAAEPYPLIGNVVYYD